MVDEALDRLDLPRAIEQSRLIASGGFAVVRQLLAAQLLDVLREDARVQAPASRRSAFSGPNKEEWRGGTPSRAMAGAASGPAQFSIYGSNAMEEVLSDICGFRLRCAGSGSYSWYTEPGDHLALHRDILKCDVTVITCLQHEGPTPTDQGILCVYPEHLWRPLSQVNENRFPVPLAPGESAVLAGGVAPHEVLPNIEGQRRLVSIVCYSLA